MSSESVSEIQLTGFDLWTPNDYSNFITICAAAIGSTLLVIFKSKCSHINLCCGLWSCDREVYDEEEEKEKEKALILEKEKLKQVEIEELKNKLSLLPIKPKVINKPIIEPIIEPII